MSRQENITATEVLIALAIMGLLLWGLATILWHPADAREGNASAGYSVEAPVDARAPGVAGTRVPIGTLSWRGSRCWALAPAPDRPAALGCTWKCTFGRCMAGLGPGTATPCRPHYPVPHLSTQHCRARRPGICFAIAIPTATPPTKRVTP
jgi:hypothetical protein